MGMWIPLPFKWFTVFFRVHNYYVFTLENSHKINILLLLFFLSAELNYVMQTVVLYLVKWLTELELKDIIHLLITYR